MIKYLIIDDEPIAHDIIKGYCDMLPNMELTKQCYDALEALDYLRNASVDIIFLDINMPKLKGFDFLKTLRNKPKVIVTTAYKEYAIEGYELEITDYLLKPFSFERFLKAVTKATEDKKKSETSIQTKVSSDEERIFLHTNKKHIQVKISEILYVQAEGNYVKVVFVDKSIVIREKLSDVLQVLPTEKFIQVHKSYLVAKKHIDKIEGNRITIDKHIIPIGKLYKMNVNELL
ncbi:LytR/AlgR family response regulator transcription factor [Flavobacterium sp. HNIBRBA15423]|uniref:LytR/AlgR family response regulator transcription factor n=1 Tax=Flavobacterium sp. HNIBRBA15423 TaxID=3458683 RepID=UPI0040444B4C